VTIVALMRTSSGRRTLMPPIVRKGPSVSRQLGDSPPDPPVS
jgi:hypothetical protein